MDSQTSQKESANIKFSAAPKFSFLTDKHSPAITRGIYISQGTQSDIPHGFRAKNAYVRVDE